MSFKKDTPLEKRMQLSEKIREKYTDRLPVIIEIQKQPNSIKLTQNRFIVQREHTIGRLLTEIRKNCENLEPKEAMFLFCDTQNGGILAPISKTIEEIYNAYKDADGFLYFTIAKENVFGDSIINFCSGIVNGLIKFFF